MKKQNDNLKRHKLNIKYYDNDDVVLDEIIEKEMTGRKEFSK